MDSDQLLTFFQALSDVNRLRIVGLLAEQELSVEQLAEMLGLRPSTVSHHLLRLSQAGLVSARAQGYYNLYRLEKRQVEQVAQLLLRSDTLPAAAAGVDQGAYDRKVLANFVLPDGRFKTLPAQRKKLEVLLRHAVQAFEPGVRYSEREVNEILARFHPDTATLRRELVGYGLLQRQAGGGEYWRQEQRPPSSATDAGLLEASANGEHRKTKKGKKKTKK